MDLGLIVMFMALPTVTIGVTLYYSSIKMSRGNAEYQEQKKKEFESRFLGEGTSQYFPVSQLLIEARRGDAFPYEPWMGEVKRYEGNLIVSEEIKQLYWENLMLVNDKYLAFDDAMDELVYQGNHNYITRTQYDSLKAQAHELQKDIIERCFFCYELMKTDGLEECKARTTLKQEKAEVPENKELGRNGFIPSEERALLNILESPIADDEMKAEAKSLLEKWRVLHQKDTLSPEVADMQHDLVTVKRIIEAQEL